MANEITLSASLAFSKGGIGSTLADSGLQFDVSGTDYMQGTQHVPITNAVALNIGGLTALGYLYIKNTDSTNYMTIEGVQNDTPTVKLKAGEVAMFRLNGNAPFVVANTAIVQADYLLIED